MNVLATALNIQLLTFVTKNEIIAFILNMINSQVYEQYLSKLSSAHEDFTTKITEDKLHVCHVILIMYSCC